MNRCKWKKCYTNLWGGILMNIVAYFLNFMEPNPNIQRSWFRLVLISQEPICKFLACLEQHALVRELLSSTSYWVCAYANNQHCVEEDITSNPRSTSFYRAMQMSQGVLLVLDSAGTPFKRIWCCFEESIAATLSWKGQIA